MSERNIKVTFGKINLSASGGTLTAMRVSAPFKRESAATTGKAAMGKKLYEKCTAHPEIGGGFSTADVIHPEGTVIMLQAQRTKRGMGYANAAIFLRLRNEAAMLAIKHIIPTGPESLLGDRIICFQGCADIMTVDELKTMGIEVSRGYVNNYMSQEEIDELFVVTVIRAQASAPPNLVRVATSRGVVTKAVAVEAPRRVRIRRN